MFSSSLCLIIGRCLLGVRLRAPLRWGACVLRAGLGLADVVCNIYTIVVDFSSIFLDIVLSMLYAYFERRRWRLTGLHT